MKARLALQLRGVADLRNDHLHEISASLARRFARVVLEELKIRALTRPAAGTSEESGVNVA